jgi:ABC-type amino acid transport substrate-binding protein
MKRIRRAALASAVAVAISLSGVDAAWAEPVSDAFGSAVVPGLIAGTSPDGAGDWSVHYQRLDGGDPDIAAAIDDGLDAEADREVRQSTWDASKTRPRHCAPRVRQATASRRVASLRARSARAVRNNLLGPAG